MRPKAWRGAEQPTPHVGQRWELTTKDWSSLNFSGVGRADAGTLECDGQDLRAHDFCSALISPLGCGQPNTQKIGWGEGKHPITSLLIRMCSLAPASSQANL